MEKYQILNELGKGSYGKVYRARKKGTLEVVAIKRIRKKPNYDPMVEIKVMENLQHKNIIKLVEWCEDDDYVYLVLELAQGELSMVLKGHQGLPEDQVQVIGKQLVSALHYLHSNRIIHRDLKPQNILIGNGGIVKLCDFGLAHKMFIDTVFLKSFKGTLPYIAPELYKEPRSYNQSADLWSLGITLYQLFVGRLPFHGKTEDEMKQRIVEDKQKYPREISCNFQSFLDGIFDKKPQNRLTWPSILNHPFIEESSECLEARVLHGETSTSMGCQTLLPRPVDDILRAACEACCDLLALINTLDILSSKEQHVLFPLSTFRGDRLCQLEIRDDQSLMYDSVVGRLVKSKHMEIAMHYCLCQRQESALFAALQLILRCCVRSGRICLVLCGLPNSISVENVVSGGGDGTMVAQIFSLLSMWASTENKESPTGEAGNKDEMEVLNINELILHSCLILATIAQYLKSSGCVSATFILTTCPKKQYAQLSLLSHHMGTSSSLHRHTASAMLAFASILALDGGGSISETAEPLLPPTSTISGFLSVRLAEKNKVIIDQYGMLSYWHGIRDGCVGLLETRLKLGGRLAVQQACEHGIPGELVRLLGDTPEKCSHCIGLSPKGVGWTVSSLYLCVSSRGLHFRRVLLPEHIQSFCNLISEAHLKILKCWIGPGGGNNGVRNIINGVIDLLEFPLVACNQTDVYLQKHIYFLKKVKVPGCILRCLEHVDAKDSGRVVAFLAAMTGHEPLADQLIEKGLMESDRVGQLLDASNTGEVLMNMLKIISNLAQLDKGFNEHLNKANILVYVKGFLSNEDPQMRAKACKAIANMCQHSDYFYSHLAEQEIVKLLIDRCADLHKPTREFARLAIYNATRHGNRLQDELRESIPLITNLLHSSEENRSREEM